MDPGSILEPLNPAQRQAVSAPKRPVLVLAGAGSGKTRVLVHRVAWLISAEGVAPQSILAVTFTNKAAAEMRTRIETLIQMPTRNLWIGTFHGLAHRLLRIHWQEAGLQEGFQILDSEDQQRMLRRVIKNVGVDENEYPPREAQWFINAQKDEGLRPDHIDDEGNVGRRQMIKVYAAYEAACNKAGVIDFGELLLRAHELLRDNADILGHYQRRFSHLLVDEFQDTNTIQYAWLRLLAGDSSLPFVVGDDDQSIYRWRGARVENLLRFQQHFPAVELIRLEQNYRSTANILQAANAVIANNSGRLGKELWTEGPKGDPIRVYAAFNERDEAEFVVNRTSDWAEQGNKRSEVAVLYRSNAQSRVFEEALMNARMPYRVYGGLRFFERAEIKDALAYLRLVANRNDDPSFERVVNTPTRGIGARTVDIIRQQARASGTSLWRAAGAVVADDVLAKRARNAVWAFLDLLEKLDRDIANLALHEQVDHVVRVSGLIEHFRKQKLDRGAVKVENLEELVSAARGFVSDPDSDLPPLVDFLAHAALEAGETQAAAYEDCVQLMTLHSAKGLEFKLVFLCGLEEGLFPHQRSIADPQGLEEERRLCYVGLTRAQHQLYLSYAEQRRLYGKDKYATASRFLRELPAELIEEVRPAIQVSRPVYRHRSIEADAPDGLDLGRRVRHRKYGEGVVINHEGSGAHARVLVNFETVGTKMLVVAYAKLELM